MSNQKRANSQLINIQSKEEK